MELPSLSLLLLFTLVISSVDISAGRVVKGSVSCLDCSHRHLAGVRVAVKCAQRTRLTFARTDMKGSFQAELPLTSSTTSPNCVAMLLGGPEKLCSSRKTLASKIVKAQEPDSYTISTPFTVFTKCPKAKTDIESSKTVDIPVPTEWGLPPTSYYTPFFPIIGIP